MKEICYFCAHWRAQEYCGPGICCLRFPSVYECLPDGCCSCFHLRKSARIKYMADEIRLVPSPEEIRHHRIELGISQYDMAIQTNLSQSMISRIESGNVNPTISTLNKILMVLHQTECEYHTPVSHIPEEEVSVR